MTRRISLICSIVLIFLLSPTRLSAQQKYIGLTLCSADLQSYHSTFGVRLDGRQHAYVEYREMPTTRLVMIVVLRGVNDKCGTIRDVREFHYSRAQFDEECIEDLHPENVVVGFFDPKFDQNHPERGARMRGPAIQSWRIDLNNLKFSPTFGNVTCVVENLAGDDDGNDLAILAHQRVLKTKGQPAE